MKAFFYGSSMAWVIVSVGFFLGHVFDVAITMAVISVAISLLIIASKEAFQ
jgi:apolipoprotein N-acyltransferase